MDRAVAEEIVRKGFEATRALGDLIRSLPAQDARGAAIGTQAAGFIAAIFEQIVDPVLDEHPDLEDEIEDRITTSGSAF